MQELIVDFITSLDGYGAAEGWPGFWGLQGPEYLGWLGEQSERDYTILMGANTYRLMSGFAADAEASETDEDAATDELARASKVVFVLDAAAPVVLAQYPADQWGCGRSCGSDEAGRRQPDVHAWQPYLVPVAPQGRPGGPFPGGRVPCDHRELRPRSDLRRLSRHRPRHGCQPNVRQQNPAA